MSVSIEVSYGELIDKITILEIKSERIGEQSKRENVARELSKLLTVWSNIETLLEDISAERASLKTVNESLWDIEDKIRLKEQAAEFDQDFITLARSVYITNDERARLKRRIDDRLGSRVVEEKSYQPY